LHSQATVTLATDKQTRNFYQHNTHALLTTCFYTEAQYIQKNSCQETTENLFTVCIVTYGVTRESTKSKAYLMTDHDSNWSTAQWRL